MKRLILAVALVCLAGCSPASNQKVAQAVDNISIVTVSFQQAEIVSHQNGLIPDTDHQFIQQQLITLATVGKTTDACIKSANSNNGYISCINTAVQAVDNINAAGGLALKSTQAKETYTATMGAIKTILLSVETVLGGGTA